MLREHLHCHCDDVGDLVWRGLGESIEHPSADAAGLTTHRQCSVKLGGKMKGSIEGG